jgi:hypothetical protein
MEFHWDYAVHQNDGESFDVKESGGHGFPSSFLVMGDV